MTALFALAFHFTGLAKPPEPATYWTSLLYAFRSTVSLTDDQVTLTAWGSFFQALLRITGPVLLGLTLLALRNRVKRRAISVADRQDFPNDVDLSRTLRCKSPTR